MLKQAFPTVKLTIYSNGSLLTHPHVVDELLDLDLFTLNLNTIMPEEFKKISRLHKSLDPEKILEDIRQFRPRLQTRGIPLWVHSIVLLGVNCSTSSLQALKAEIDRLHPEKHIIRTACKECWGFQLSEEEKQSIKAIFGQPLQPTIILL